MKIEELALLKDRNVILYLKNGMKYTCRVLEVKEDTHVIVILDKEGKTITIEADLVGVYE